MLKDKALRDHISLFAMLLELLMAEVTPKWSLAAYKRESLSSQRDIPNLLLALGPMYQSIHWEETVILQWLCNHNQQKRCRKTRTHVSFSVMFCYNFPSRTQIFGFLLDYMFLKKISEARTSQKLAAVWEVKGRNFYSPLQLRCRQQLTLSFSPLAHKGSWVITYD